MVLSTRINDLPTYHVVQASDMATTCGFVFVIILKRREGGREGGEGGNYRNKYEKGRGRGVRQVARRLVNKIHNIYNTTDDDTGSSLLMLQATIFVSTCISIGYTSLSCANCSNKRLRK